MKNINLVIILFLLIGCKKNEQPINNFITVDITANYPKKGDDSSRFYGCRIYSVRNNR